MDEAHSETVKALQLDPQSHAAQDLIRQIDAREAQKR
jgi:hypothetical protein